MSNVSGWARTGLLAVLLAMVGFSYSLATNNSSSTSDGSSAATGTVIGSFLPLAFANPFVTGSTDRDYGDAISGSSVTRLTRAKGGVAPYSFTAGTTPTGLTLFSNGILTGTLGSFSPKALRFAVTVKDSFGTAPHSVTEQFRLTIINSTLLRFGNDTLSDGTKFQAYSDNLVVLNGKAPYSFSVTNVTLNGTAKTGGLGDLGLGLSNDGVVYGVPIVSGTVGFTASAKDANGKFAVGRSGTGSSQAFTFTIASGTAIQGSFVATQITVKAGVAGKDGISMKGVINMGGEAITSLSGKPLSVRIGGITAAAAIFGGKGVASTAKGVKPAQSGKVGKFGVFSFTDKFDTIGATGITGGTISLPVEVRVGDAVVGSQFLSFVVKTGKQTTLTYKIGGKTGSDLGGAISLLKVTGADDKAGTGDAWKVAFGGVAPASINLSTTTQVTGVIGNLALTPAPVTVKNGKIAFKTNGFNFAYDSIKGKGAYTTPVLPSSSTGIPQASKGSSPFFAASTTFLNGSTTILTAEGGQKVFPKGTKYSSQ